jgi:hypothetical protein
MIVRSLPVDGILIVGKRGPQWLLVNVMQATRHARQILVGALPSGATEAEVTSLFNRAMMAAGCCTELGFPVVGANMNHSQRYAVLELRNVAEASNALALDGMICRGSQLTLRRPNDYKHAEVRACQAKSSSLPDK